MNVKHEKVSDQMQELVIEIQKSDYAENVEKSLKKYRRDAAVPGFRKGNAPMGIITKMYGKNALVLEIDRIVNENMNKYFEDNNIKYIFEPMPVESKTKADFDNPQDFVFTYEYALRPDVKIDYKSIPSVVDFKIVPDDSEITNYIKQLRERHGKYVNPEEIAEDDSVSVDFGGEKEAFFFIRDLKDDAKKKFIGKKLNDKVKLDMRKAFSTDNKFALAFNLDVKNLNDTDNYKYDMVVKRIGRIELAELNDDFFKNAFPEGNVKNEKELKDEAKSVLEKQYAPESERMFMNSAIETLLDNVSVEIPDEFAKRYIKTVQKDMTDEQLATNFDSYKRSFQWQILETALVEGEDVQVSRADVENYFRDFFMKNYFGNFNPENVKDQVDKIVQQSMSNQDYVKNAYDTLYDQKLISVLRKKMNVEHKEGDFKAFIDQISENSTKTNEKDEEAKPKKTTRKKTTAKTEAKNEETTATVEEKPKKTRKTTKKTDKE